MKKAFAPGKMILSGEYAVVFGYPGVAVPASVGVEVAWEDTPDDPMIIAGDGIIDAEAYIRSVISLCAKEGGPQTGQLTIRNRIPFGRGMGSSTAIVIAVARLLLGDDCRKQALMIENAVNPGNSGLDFAVIWENRPVRFTKGTAPMPVTISLDFLKNSELIDTGKPADTTPELVAWIRSRKDAQDVAEALKTIGQCTERLMDGEDPKTVIRDHHRAQVMLGVVPEATQTIIADIEKNGGAAKVLGAGARTGGGGMVLKFTR